jgi:putative phosphoesterase
MLLAILSDTHDRSEIMAVAVRTLSARGAEFFIHCGDVCAPRLLDHLAGLRSAFVFGNCDWDRQSLARYAEAIGVPCYNNFADLELGGKKIAITHGDDHARLEQAIHSGRFDYIFHGHTHVRRDERIGPTRIINPGALYRASVKTAALLDTEKDLLEFVSFVAPRE